MENSPVSDKKWNALGLLWLFASLTVWSYALFVAPSEEHQGNIYRIIYVHVPSAFAAFFSSLMLCIQSVRSLVNRRESTLNLGRAWAEVGLIFTIITLATGSIWGKPTWGTWWTWDARLTTTFVLALLFAGYLLLHASIPAGEQRIRTCAVIGIIIFVDVPIIYKSVSWWRTLHQPPSMMREGGSTMSSEILMLILSGIVCNIIGSSWLARARWRNLCLQDELEQRSFAELS